MFLAARWPCQLIAVLAILFRLLSATLNSAPACNGTAVLHVSGVAHLQMLIKARAWLHVRQATLQ
jgi:hypothetical protein